MAAYASLVILAKNIDLFHGDLNHINHDLDLKPLYEKVVQLQTIMEDCPSEILSQEFQATIRDFGDRANNDIEYHYLVVTVVLRCGYKRVYNLPKFHELTDEAASLILEAPNLGGDVATTTDLSMQMKELSLAPSSSSAHAPIPATQTVRLYSDITNLEERFYEGCSQRQVIPIVGMGGSGKTTLANFLFNKSRTVRRFDRRAWITVSQSYSRCMLLSQILRQFNEPAPENPTDAQYRDLGAKLSRVLRNRRYLIVIDDVWSEQLWADINFCLPDCGNSSRILLTTRLEDVANYVVRGYIHKVELLNLDSSWSLLKDTVFGQERDCPVELEEIGKSIAKDCAGLPLAIVVIAGVLSSANNRKDLWEEIAEDVRKTINMSSRDRVEKIFSLSYSNLPHNLKPCFLYLACFPEDYKINVSELIMLWEAEGFLKPSKFEKSEEVAYEYVKELVKKNLVLVSEQEDYNDEIVWCHLHDMIREQCVERCSKENFITPVNDKCELSSNDLIRFSVDSMTDFSFVQNLVATNVRSAHCIRPWPGFIASTEVLLLMRFPLLRVLDVHSFEFPEFPYEVCQLLLLRYLAIKVMNNEMDYVEVPSSIKELQCLQVLNVISLRTLHLPLEIWEMPKLRHVLSPGRVKLPDPAIGTRSSSSFSTLENLQTLAHLSDFKCTEHVPHMIPNLKQLWIVRLSHHGLQNLVRFTKLETLVILSYGVGRNIQMPRSLKVLSLFSCRLPWSELGRVAGLLPNLEMMCLASNGCYGDVWEVKEREFSKLKVLRILVADLVTWKFDGDDRRIFPSLQQLFLYELMNLVEFPRCIGEIETLRLITVDHCSNLLVKWAREVKEEQESYGDKYLEVIVEEKEEEEKEEEEENVGKRGSNNPLTRKRVGSVGSNNP